jgi:thymidine phosphorylase
MSKKLAERLEALVLDVKFGSGAFMKTLPQAHELAQSLVATGRRMGVPTTALITDMNQPLGKMAGNAVEVNEALETLSGGGPEDLRDLTIRLGAELLRLTGTETFAAAARDRLQRLLDSGEALEKFREMVTAQGGDLDAPRPVARANVVKSRAAGYVSTIDTEQLGRVIIQLGGGRIQIGDPLDHSTGLEVLVRLGDKVKAGQSLVRVFAKSAAAAAVKESLVTAFTITDAPPEPVVLVAERIEKPA